MLFRFKVRASYVVGLPVLFFVFMAILTNVSAKLQPEDVVAIKTILDTHERPAIQSFEDEIKVIRWAQARVFHVAPGMDAIPDYSDREPIDLLKARSGLCYDRSRTLDKLLRWLGFETRHVYILFADEGDETNAWQFVAHALSRSSSHAVTEVKTSRGWLLVDSNEPWISLNRDLVPVSAGQIHERRAEFEAPPEYLKTPLWAIRGMYSRKGQLYRPFVFFPEFNWPDFLSWVFGNK